MALETIWRFLVVDDKQADEVAEFVAGNRILQAPQTVMVEKCENFSEAIDKLETLRIDLIILDLKDDSIDLEDEAVQFAGEKVFDQIRQHRFIPVVFHTAYAYKVSEMRSPFVQVVSRDNPEELRKAIKKIFGTGLLHLIKHLEAEQREYMWDHVQNHWHDFNTSYDKADLTYLIARRLANALERSSIKRFLAGQEAGSPLEDDDTIHPVEMYIYPPNTSEYLAGDIFKNHNQYWIMVTPSCDLVQGKADKMLLAECMLLDKQPEYKSVQEYWKELKKAEDENSGTQPKQTPVKNLKNLLRNNRQGQSDRYKFLPGTFFVPDLVIDFQSLMQVSNEDVNGFERIASLDNPFAEACLAKFSRYYSRLGTPDLDIEIVYGRLAQTGKKALHGTEEKS